MVFRFRQQFTRVSPDRVSMTYARIRADESRIARDVAFIRSVHP